jgi:hypothetical protein
MQKPKPRNVISLDRLQEFSWKLQNMINQADGPAKAVLERARDQIGEIAMGIYGD